MLDSLEELLKQNIELMNRFITENDELNRAFRKETLGEFISSRTVQDDQDQDKGGENGATGNNIASETQQLERETGTDDVGRESRRAGREPAAGETPL